MSNHEVITCDYAGCTEPFAYRIGKFNLCCMHMDMQSEASKPEVSLADLIAQKQREIEALGLPFPYRCRACIEGDVPVPSSVSGEWVHPAWKAGRVVCGYSELFKQRASKPEGDGWATHCTHGTLISEKTCKECQANDWVEWAQSNPDKCKCLGSDSSYCDLCAHAHQAGACCSELARNRPYAEPAASSAGEGKWAYADGADHIYGPLAQRSAEGMACPCGHMKDEHGEGMEPACLYESCLCEGYGKMFEPAASSAVPTASAGGELQVAVDPYRVEVERNGCDHCGSGRMWDIVFGPEDCALGVTYGSEDEALALASELNHAYNNGLRAKQNLPANWIADSSLETWFPLTAEDLKRKDERISDLERQLGEEKKQAARLDELQSRLSIEKAEEVKLRLEAQAQLAVQQEEVDLQAGIIMADEAHVEDLERQLAEAQTALRRARDGMLAHRCGWKWLDELIDSFPAPPAGTEGKK